MGTCATKEFNDLNMKFNFELPMRESFNKDYMATSEFFTRSEMVNIFRATNRSTKVDVLVKQLSKTISKQSVMYELYLLLKCDHPHIIKLLDYFETENHYFLVYQYHENANVLDYFKEKDSDTTIEDLRTLFRQILMAINYLHSKNIFHGKLDLSNIYYGNNKLCLSGLAYSKDLSLYNIKKGQLISHETFLSTAFQAPETTQKQYGLPSDIWSAGIIFYSLVAGEMPFKGQSKVEIEKEIRTRPLDTVYLVKKGTPQKLADLIFQALTKNYKSRPTAEALLNHPFFETAKKENSHDVINTLQEIKLFAKKNKLSQKMHLTIADLLMTQRDKAAVADSFHKFDINHDGTITLDEFIKAIQYAGLSYKEREAKRLFDQLDQNHNGSIEYTEFLAIFANARKEEFTSTLKSIFDELDTDNDNFISVNEFIKYLGQQPELTEEVDTFKKLAGSDKKMTYDEFASLVRERFEMIG